MELVKTWGFPINSTKRETSIEERLYIQTGNSQRLTVSAKAHQNSVRVKFFIVGYRDVTSIAGNTIQTVCRWVELEPLQSFCNRHSFEDWVRDYTINSSVNVQGDTSTQVSASATPFNANFMGHFEGAGTGVGNLTILPTTESSGFFIGINVLQQNDDLHIDFHLVSMDGQPGEIWIEKISVVDSEFDADKSWITELRPEMFPKPPSLRTYTLADRLIGDIVYDINTHMDYWGQGNTTPQGFRIVSRNNPTYGEGLTVLQCPGIMAGAFDANEPLNAESAFSGWANWRMSNVRQWANSESNLGQWFTPSHQFDTPPNAVNGINPYEQNAGYLSTFSPALLGLLQTVENVTVLHTQTGVLLDTTQERVFVPSISQMNVFSPSTIINPALAVEGWPFEYYPQLDMNQNVPRRVIPRSLQAIQNAQQGTFSNSMWLRGDTFGELWVNNAFFINSVGSVNEDINVSDSRVYISLCIVVPSDTPCSSIATFDHRFRLII